MDCEPRHAAQVWYVLTASANPESREVKNISSRRILALSPLLVCFLIRVIESCVTVVRVATYSSSISVEAYTAL